MSISWDLFPKKQILGSLGAEQCVVPSVPLFCYSINAYDVFIHQDTFQMSAQRNGSILFVLINLFTEGLKCIFLVEPI